MAFHSAVAPSPIPAKAGASEGLGVRAAEGSGVICVAIVGGAIVTLVTGNAADLWGLKLALIVPAVCRH